MQALAGRRLVGLLTVVAVAWVAMLSNAAAQPSSQEAPAEQITVVMTEVEPFVENSDGVPAGFYAEIWDRVAARLGVDYDTLWVDSFSDLLPALSDGRATVAVAPLAPTADREAMYDFTSAVISSGPQLGVSERLDSRPSVIRSLFDSRVLRLVAIALAALVVLAHVMWLLERKRHGKDGDFHGSYLQGIWDGIWWSTVTATTVGYGDKAPKSFAGRLVALIVMLSSLVLVGAFVSQVTSVMAEDLSRNEVESLGDVHDPIGVVRGSSFADFVESQGFETVQFDSQHEVFEAARTGVVDVIVSNPFSLQALDSRFGLVAVDDVLYEEFETFGLAQGSPWREPINQVVADLHASGEIAEIIKDGLN